MIQKKYIFFALFVLLLIPALRYIYKIKNVEIVEDQTKNDSIGIIWRNVEPLEPENNYPEIQPSSLVSERIRSELNKKFKDDTILYSCLYSDKNKNLLIETLESQAEYNKDISKKISNIDLRKLDIDKLRRLYNEIEKPVVYGQYSIIKNKNRLLTITESSLGSSCGWEAHPSHDSITYTINLTTGEKIILDDIFTVNKKFLDFINNKFGQNYNPVKDDPDSICLKYINDKYLKDEFIIDKLKKEVSFTIDGDTLNIIPKGYPSYIEGPCSDTSIELKLSEIQGYIKDKSLIDRLE